MKKFKVGDWVIIDNSTYQIHKENNGMGNISIDVVRLIVKKGLSVITPWQPQPGEWCWFWTKGNLSPHIMQFSQIGLDDKTFLSGFAGYDYCEPFIGTLPTFIRN